MNTFDKSQFLKAINSKELIFWDFDGVIIESDKVRTYGFEKVLEDFPEEEVAQLRRYHKANGGLSRYVKFRYFFEKIRNEEVSADKIENLAGQFSEIMLEKLTEKQVLIDETVEFISDFKETFQMHIVSGSDGEELRSLCKSLEIEDLFLSINGSPTPKKQLVKDLLKSLQISSDECILIGDSINDYEAAKNSEVEFFAFNNSALKDQGFNYISSFK